MGAFFYHVPDFGGGECMKCFKEHCAEPDFGWIVDLFTAVYHGDVEGVRKNTRGKPADALRNVTGPQMQSVLHMAVSPKNRQPSSEIWGLLLEKGADLDLRANNGKSARDYMKISPYFDGEECDSDSEAAL